MTEAPIPALDTALIGIGATRIIDLWTLLLRAAFRVPATNYAIGVLYAGLLVGVVGPNWLAAPTLLPALAVGLATLPAPFLLMQPAMGFGVASSKASRPNAARLLSLAAHVVFGLGLYLSALLCGTFGR